MEKKQVKLVDFFEQYPEELFEGIRDLVIERFDFFDSQVKISLSGFNTMDNENALSGFYRHMKKHLDMDIAVKFADFEPGVSDFGEFFRKVSDYVYLRFDESGCPEARLSCSRTQ